MGRFRVASDCTGITVEHQPFEVQRATYVVEGKEESVSSVRVPDALDAQMIKMGFVRAPSIPADHGPPVNDRGDRLDGPTLAEYVEAGYSAEHYPPQGYASKEDPKALTKAQKVAREKREADEKAKADADAAATKAADEAKAKADADKVAADAARAKEEADEKVKREAEAKAKADRDAKKK